jgi:hypothetical protein
MGLGKSLKKCNVMELMSKKASGDGDGMME